MNGRPSDSANTLNGRARTTYKHRKPIEQWDVLLKNHHQGYIEWNEYERNQRQLAHNNYGKNGGVKSGRGGLALLAGLLCCGRRLMVVYTGRYPAPKYRCEKPDAPPDRKRCMAFSAAPVDEAIGAEIRRALEPLSIEAALEAERMHHEQQMEAHRLIELELEQARYKAALAERRYAACDPDNRLIAVQLAKGWESALERTGLRGATEVNVVIQRAAVVGYRHLCTTCRRFRFSLASNGRDFKDPAASRARVDRRYRR